MRRRHLLAAAPALPAAALTTAAITTTARAAAPLVVVEMFTSQSCSSCPPADDLLGALVRERPDVLALSFHVTYWDRLGWRDRFSLPAATERQRRYATTLGNTQIYTPQAVVQGRRDAIGSDRASLLAAIRSAPALAVPLQVAPAGAGLEVAAGAGAGSGTLWLVGFDEHHTTAIGGGENGGRRLSYSHVVRSIAPLGPWRGAAVTLAAARPEGERTAVLLQAAEGVLVGAAVAA